MKCLRNSIVHDKTIFSIKKRIFEGYQTHFDCFVKQFNKRKELLFVDRWIKITFSFFLLEHLLKYLFRQRISHSVKV